MPPILDLNATGVELTTAIRQKEKRRPKAFPRLSQCHPIYSKHNLKILTYKVVAFSYIMIPYCQLQAFLCKIMVCDVIHKLLYEWNKTISSGQFHRVTINDQYCVLPENIYEPIPRTDIRNAKRRGGSQKPYYSV